MSDRTIDRLSEYMEAVREIEKILYYYRGEIDYGSIYYDPTYHIELVNKILDSLDRDK